MNPLEWLREDEGERSGAGLGARIDWPRVLLVTLAVAVLAGLVVAAATSTAAFGPYNPSWDGASELQTQLESESDAETELTRETARYEAVDPNATTAFVIAPAETYGPDDADRVRQFVENGGTLVVLENFGNSGNELLGAVGATARTEGELLRDEREYYRGPPMPVATGVENHTLTADVDQLTLNYASSIVPGEATVLVRTSEYAYRDTNRDDELSDDEELGAYPVAAVESVSDGRVIVVGDPSITINAMVNEPDNAAFLRAPAADADRVLIDLSHTDDLPPLAAATLTLRETPLLQILVGALGIGAVAAGSRYRVQPRLERVRSTARGWVGRRNRTPIDDLAAESGLELADEHRAAVLRKRHPEWDEQRIQRVIAALNRDGAKRENEE